MKSGIYTRYLMLTDAALPRLSRKWYHSVDTAAAAYLLIYHSPKLTKIQEKDKILDLWPSIIIASCRVRMMIGGRLGNATR